MKNRAHIGHAARTAYGRAVIVIRVVFFAVVTALVLLALSEVPIVRGWLGNIGPQRPLVGIIAGHWQNDSGAVCPDGLQEVDVTLAVARRVAHLLQEQGYDAEVLPEYAAQLDGYSADALLSIHADSCVDYLSGFKVVGSYDTTVAERHAGLVRAIEEAYALATGLALHPDTITDDMLQYHAFGQVAPTTPAAIIECGFLGGDRYLLTEEPDRVAVGIANGLAAFLRQAEED